MNRFAVFIIILILPAMVLAKPAPWYRWYSKLDGKTICRQTSPGKGWVREKTRYLDARCEKPGQR